jgi:uncharacterized membrane protein HdeD (DUF308 family)
MAGGRATAILLGSAREREVVVLERVARYWWVLALRGALAVLFGVLLFAWPALGLVVLVALFGAYALVDGVLALAAALGQGEDRGHRGAQLLEGVVGVLAGLAALVWPGMTALVLLYIIAAWAIVTGLAEIVAAVRLRAVIDNELWLGLGGLLSILFGLYLIVLPGAGALAVAWLIGVYAVLFGLALIALALRLRGMGPDRAAPSTA